MKKIGITGNIGSGKSTVSGIIKMLGYKVFESDMEVSKLFENRDIIKIIKDNFNSKITGLITENKINRDILGEFVFSNPKELKLLEKIIHPEIWERKERFFVENNKEKIIFFDIPLLFEKKLQSNFNYIIYTFVTRKIQRERVLKRKNMNEKKFNHIISNQNKLSESQKKKISLKINTNTNKAQIKKKVENFLFYITSQKTK